MMTAVKTAIALADSTDTDWPRVGLLMLCGVFVATQVGKLPPAMPALRDHFGASLVQLGWISSVFNLIAALIALAAGLVADRVGRRTVLKLGLLALGMGALLGAGSDGIGLLFVSRVVEGLGFVGIVVAAPALMREAAGLPRQRLVLGLWSSYMALGMTAMLLAAPLLIGLLGWRGGWWMGVLGSALLLLAVLRAFPGSGRAAAQQTTPGLLHGLRVTTPWLLAGCFTVYTLQWMAMMVWLPTFLHDEFHLGLGQATVVVAVVIIANAPGNWLGGYLSQRGLAPAHLILASGLVMGVTGWAAFAADLDPGLRFALCVAFSFIGGVLPASIYACVPAVAARRQNFGSVNGLVVQASNIGALLGPPLAAALVAASGWRGVGPAYLLTSALSALLIVLAARAPEMRPGAAARVSHG
ncbi:MAG: MFS transporter [Polaromonas sp.]|nr:MFS transporter [Polaromonas sp.]